MTFGDDYGNTGLALDNGHCHVTASVDFFSGMAPTNVANCLANAVEVPDLVGTSLGYAETQLSGQPLAYHIAYKPATAAEPLGLVVGQSPRTGVLSAYAPVKLTVARPLHGVVPNLVGSDPAGGARAAQRAEDASCSCAGRARASWSAQTSCGGGRRLARPGRAAHAPSGNGRLRKREPASP